MKQLFSFLILLTLPFLSWSQTYEVGGFIGGANYIGDIGKSTFIKPNNLALGGLVKWNRSDRHSFRASVNFAKIQGDDSKASEARRKERGYKFSNTIKEFNLGMEFTFWEYDTHSGKPIQTPYLYTGITTFMHDNLYRDSNDKFVKDGNKVSFAIPIVLGYKMSLGRQASLGFEIGARYTFTDNLDGSDPNGAGSQHYKFGNSNFNDWYVFSGINLTFAFGRTPCYSKF